MQAAARCLEWSASGYCRPEWIWTDQFGNEAPVGSFWCAATCGACAGPEATWTTGRFANKQLSVSGVGVYVWKTSSPFTSFILQSLELHAGAHYYVATPYTTTYNKAGSTLVLPSVDPALLSLRGRIACMAMSARGSDNCAIDFGVENAGSGWFAMAYGGCAGKLVGSTSKKTHPEAAKVTLSLEAQVTSTQDMITGSFSFYDSKGALIADSTVRLMLAVDKGSFFPNTVPAATIGTGAVAPMVRWYRFMSLLHSGGNDYALNDKADASYMSNAQFTNLKLYDWAAKKDRAWDISKVEHAWHVETANVQALTISPASAPNKDTFSCVQQVQYI